MKQSVVRIGILDDNEEFIAAVRKTLSSAPDLELVREYTTAEAVINTLGGGDLDIILLDIDLGPDEQSDGFAALQYINDHSLQIKCIMLTGILDINTYRKARRGGAMGYLLKSDVNADNLPTYLQRCMEGQSFVSPLVGDTMFAATWGQSQPPGDPEFVQQIKNLPSGVQGVLALLLQGLDTKAIATKLCLSEPTVRNYLSKAYQATGVSNRAKLLIKLNAAASQLEWKI